WWLSWELGLSEESSVPYHTAARRPFDPATDHGMMFVFAGGLLICTGGDHVCHPDADVEYEYQTCQAVGSCDELGPLLPWLVTHTAYALRALSSAIVGNRPPTSAPFGRSAILTSCAWVRAG